MKFMLMFIPLIILLLQSTLSFNYSNKIISISWQLNSDIMMPLNCSILCDWMSLPFAMTVITISSMITIYSQSYIPKIHLKSYLIFLFLFISSMIMLIFTDNIAFMILGWDGLGLTSYILVMFYQNANSLSSSNITLLSNRIGDMCIISSIALMTMNNNLSFSNKSNFTYLVMMLLMLAAISKSAQFPLSAWLPAAMAAPTPISALVHSSTLVTAGAFIMIRLMSFPTSSSLLLMILACITSFYAGLAANWEQDMKKIIALSTLSQIGMIMFSISLGQAKISFFHMNTHALFKSTLFLSAGFLIHTSFYQDSRHLNSNLMTLPLITNTLLITNMSLMGLPFLSGFYSKDLIMETMLNTPLTISILMIMLLSLSMTISYSTRMMTLIIKMSNKNQPFQSHNFHKNMKIPIMMILPLSITMGTLMLWNMKPYFSSPIINNNLKLMIPLIILLSIITSTLLNFKSKMYHKLGLMAISLWNTHFISSNPAMKFTNSSKTIQFMDNSWNESNFTTSTIFLSKMNNTWITMSLLLPPLFILITIMILF